MLSKKNVDKLVMTGLYRHAPDKRYRDPMYWDDLYWCFNWTFRVRHHEDDDTWYMVDTYFNDKYIELTDDNFDEFEFLFDFNEVKKCSGTHIEEYDESDWWHVAVNSGGMYCGGTYFLKKDAVKKKDRVIQRLENEIEHLEREIAYKKETLQRVKNDDIDLTYV